MNILSPIKRKYLVSSDDESDDRVIPGSVNYLKLSN